MMGKLFKAGPLHVSTPVGQTLNLYKAFPPHKSDKTLSLPASVAPREKRDTSLALLSNFYFSRWRTSKDWQVFHIKLGLANQVNSVQWLLLSL